MSSSSVKTAFSNFKVNKPAEAIEKALEVIGA